MNVYNINARTFWLELCFYQKVERIVTELYTYMLLDTSKMIAELPQTLDVAVVIIFLKFSAISVLVDAQWDECVDIIAESYSYKKR